jgi:hypothetical protein
MFSADDPKLPAKVIRISQDLSQKAQTAKIQIGTLTKTLNDIEDQQGFIQRCCGDPDVVCHMDREQLAALGQDLVRTAGAVSDFSCNAAKHTRSLDVAVAVSGVTATTSVTPIVLAANASPNAKSAFERIRVDWVDPTRVNALTRHVDELLKATGCDKPYSPGIRSALDHFQAAWNLYRQATNNTRKPLGPLLEVRACIDETMASLLRRRRSQSPAGNGESKVRTLLNQLRSPDISDDSVTRIATQFTGLYADLSDAKQAEYGYETTGLNLLAASEWLSALLACIDVTRLRE